MAKAFCNVQPFIYKWLEARTSILIHQLPLIYIIGGSFIFKIIGRFLYDYPCDT